MTDNTHADDAWKHHEENNDDSTPEPDDLAVSLNRHQGKVTTEMGGKSVSDLMDKV